MKIGSLDSQSMSINGMGNDSMGISGVGKNAFKMPETSSSSAPGESFATTLNEAIGQVNQLHQVADQKTQALTTGKTDNVADVMLASEKADIALRVMVQVRNKIIDAYQEIMRMQV
mgnify:FL=1